MAQEDEQNGKIKNDYINDDPIINSIGQIGKWQVVVSLSLMMTNFAIAWHHLEIIFLAPQGNDNHRCETPGVEDICSPDCKSIEYDRSIFEETIITEWDLVCDGQHLANLSQTIFMLGIVIGNLLFGSLADKFGRKLPFLVACLLTVVFGVSVAFSPYFWLFCVLRFFVAVNVGGLMVMSFVIIMEIIGPKWREFMSVIYQLPFNFGHLSLVGLSYILRNWRHLQLTISLLSILKLLYFWVIPESPRWLFTIGKLEKTGEILRKAARWNKLPQEGIQKSIEEAYQRKLIKTDGVNGSAIDLIRYPNMRKKTFVILFNWFSCGLTFFGAAQYIGNISGNIYLNVALSASMCIPGTLITILMCKYLGRKFTLIVANLIAGISFIIIACIPKDSGIVTVIFAVLGLFGMSIAFPTVYLFSGELFPTVVRNIGIGLSSMMSRVGSMVAPFVVGLSQSQYIIPPLVFGCFPFCAAILCYFLPETKGKELPDTMKEGEEFGKKKKKSVNS